jgi:hypothetical protein
MKRHTVTSLVSALLALLFFLVPQQFTDDGGAAGQRRGSRKVARPQAVRKATIDYSKFLHITKEHQGACNTCHKVPTSNWQKARDFPDVADFPGHDACVCCHRGQFFKGAQPVICRVCHTKTSPRHDARFSFRNPSRPQQFTIKFPHDKHQDVIAGMRLRPLFGQLIRASFVRSAHAPDDKPKKYNNCEICHVANTKTPVAPTAGWNDGFVPDADTFKAAPENHASCFDCHWRGQEPTKDNCKGCHLPAMPYFASTTPQRISMKFRHDGGGEKKNHPAECTTCHINITKATTLQGLEPDVPIFPSCAASSCHQSVITEELSEYNKAPGSFKCVKCHTTDVGTKKPPNSHAMAILG